MDSASGTPTWPAWRVQPDSRLPQTLNENDPVSRGQSKTGQPVLLAIDIAKHRNEVLIAVPGRQRRRRLTVRNAREDVDRLVETLAAFEMPVQVGFEPTGDYHRPLAWRLDQAGFELRLTSSLSLARTREAIHNFWDKDEPKDAQMMLHKMQTGRPQIWHDPLVQGVNDIQEQTKTHAVISQTKTEFWHRLRTHYLPRYFPEIERFMGTSRRTSSSENRFRAILYPS